MSRFVAALTLILAASGATVFGQGPTIAFSPEQVYIIPGVDKIDEALFNDIDYDGQPEIMVRRGGHILVYSQSDKAVLFETDIDTAKWRGIVFADINRDSIVDIAVTCFHDYPLYSDSALTIDFYDGAAGFVSARQYFPSAYDYTVEWPKYTSELTTFKAKDVNSDGYDELFLSYCNWIFHPNLPTPHIWGNDQYAVCKLFYSFPDSTMWNGTSRMADPIVVDNGEASFLMTNSLLDYSYRMMTEYYIYRRSAIRFDTSFDRVYVFSDSALIMDQSKSTCIYASSRQNLLMECAGDLIASNHGQEFVASFDFVLDCYEYGEIDPMPDSSGRETRMYFMPSPDSAELVWVHARELYSDYIFLPDYPGYYFAFSNGQLIQLDGATGQQVASSKILPPGTGHWDYPYGDNNPRRVVFRADTVTIYRVDIVTDADDEYQPPLPATLSLGKPYPNPFNAVQNIPVTITPGHELTVNVYNLLGQKVETLYEGRPSTATLTLTWRADKFASGIYFVRATGGGDFAIVRSILLK